MNKKKVLFVVHQLNYGGVQKSMISALNAIDYEKYEVTLYIRKGRLELLNQVNNGVSEIIINDDKTHYYRKLYSLFIILLKKIYSIFGLSGKEKAADKRLSEYIAEQKIKYEKKRYFSDGRRYDVAVSYIQGYTAKLVADCIEAERKIMFFHGSTDENHSLHESILDRIDTVVGVNEGVQKVLEKLYPLWKGRITYLENYVDADDIREKALEINVAQATDLAVLCTCGRISPVKGFDLAVEAAKILKNNHIRFIWYFIGDGPERERLEKMIVENSLSECITITGMKDNPYPLIKACDIYIQPSYEEAYGLTIAEAQILCRPVVSTKTVGGKYLVKDGETGVITDISAEGLAEGIMKLITNPELCQKITENLSKIDYDIEKERYKKQWEDILGGQKA